MPSFLDDINAVANGMRPQTGGTPMKQIPPKKPPNAKKKHKNFKSPRAKTHYHSGKNLIDKFRRKSERLMAK